MTREQFAERCNAEDAAWEREYEALTISRRLEALYHAVATGDDTVYTRQRIGRLEALQMALQGYPGALAV